MDGQCCSTYVRDIESLSVGIQIPATGDAHTVGRDSHPRRYVQHRSRVPEHIEAGQKLVLHSQDSTDHEHNSRKQTKHLNS